MDLDSGSQLDPFEEPKYRRHQSARRNGAERLTTLEAMTLFHVAAFVVCATWDFGGNDLNLRLPLLLWGTLSVPILVIGLLTRLRSSRSEAARHLLWLAPALLFNAFVIVSALNPNQTQIFNGTEPVFVTGDFNHWLPSSARPHLAFSALWLFDCAYFSAFNLALAVRQRRALRGLLLVLSANAFVLAVFGTLQRLGGAKGIYFGLVHSSNPYFFSTFIYHNHWGAYMLLCISGALGLFWHYLRRGDRQYRDVWHSPAFLGAVAILFLAAAIPLSSSRSSTLLLIGVLVVTCIHGCIRVIRSRRGHNESAALPLMGIAAIVIVSASAIFWLALPVIKVRWALTKSQVSSMEQKGSIGARITLYRDTIAMGNEQPVYGWGMGSYPTIFYRYNSAVSRRDNLPIFYADAHSDWLQAYAELGLVGSALIGLCALLPLLSLFRRGAQSLLSRYLLFGCATILVYAWVEFPFGNFAVVIVWWLSLFTAVAYGSLA